jgi:hypothetical protein
MAKLMVLPLLLHVLLTTWIGVRSFNARYAAARAGKAKLPLIETDPAGWPRDVRLIGNNFDNQFQSPMLWYALVAIVLALGLEDSIFAAFGWMFLVTRAAHLQVHVRGGQVPLRARIYFTGFLTIVCMWLWLAARLFFAVSL